ncbi:MAG: hypothetical protein IT381_29110 [Deltaproteobacteria bacterium]|nr:hypothetical protein [Deltaproteobacteria bacterium]
MARKRKTPSSGGTLLGDPVSVIAPLHRTKRVEVDSRGEVWFAVDEAGDEWVTKEVSGANLAAEILSWHLARAIGVRIPHGAAVVPHDGTTSWATRTIPNALHWTPSLGEVVDPVDAAGVLVLDCLIHNGDRHEANLMWTPLKGGKGLLHAIDHDLAAIGDVEEFRDLVVSPPPRLSHAPGFPYSRAASAIGRYVDATNALSRAQLTAYVRDALDWAKRSDKTAEHTDTVYNRCQAIGSIVAQYLKEAGVSS